MNSTEEKVVNIASLIAPSFDGVFFDVQRHKYTHYWLAGGRGSTKSSFASLNVPLGILQNPDCRTQKGWQHAPKQRLQSSGVGDSCAGVGGCV